MVTESSRRDFTPAAGHDLFLPLYDPLMKLFGFDALRAKLIDQAVLERGHRVLDIGCGTGTLAIQIKQRSPAAVVIGVDPDERSLAYARRKAARAGAAVAFDRGYADALQYPDGTFDRVFSSMMFHHLASDQKDATLREVRRVLKPGGRLELLDFAQPGAHLHGVLARLVHSRGQLQDNGDERLLTLMARAGLASCRKVNDAKTAFGRVGFFQATAPL